MALYGFGISQLHQGGPPSAAHGAGSIGPAGSQMMQQMMMLMMRLMMMVMAQSGLGGACGCQNGAGFRPGMSPAFGGGGHARGGGNGLNGFLGGYAPGGAFGGNGGSPATNSMSPAAGTGQLTQLSADPKERVRQVVEAAKRTYPDQPHMAKLAAAQALLESGLHGSQPSKLAREHNNLFGIKGSGTAGSVNMQTGEHLNGRNVTVNAGFAKNATLEDSFAQHKKLMSNSRYAGVLSAGSFEGAASAVKAAGYATDPSYTQKLMQIYQTHLAQYF